MDDVTWRRCPGAPNYQVSSDGRVRSVDQTVKYKDGRQRKFRGQERVVSLVRGYPHVTLSVAPGVKKNFNVHTLVCEAFHGPRPSAGLEVRHLDGNPRNNRVDNLAWGTKKENAQDSIRHGTNKELNKAQCKYGHPFTDENTHNTPRGGRMCRTCMRRNGKAHYDRNRVEYSRRTREKLEKRAAEEGRTLRKRNRNALTEQP